MTLLRDPLSHHGVLQEVIAQLGWSTAIAAAGRAERTLRAWSEPSLGHRLTLEAALPGAPPAARGRARRETKEALAALGHLLFDQDGARGC